MEKLIGKFFYRFTIETLSALSIGQTDNELTDHDVVVYENTKIPFIPATSICGALFGFDKNLRNFFGIDVNDKQSPAFISDGRFKSYELTIRDGIAVGYDNKVTKKGAKYDVQAIDQGAVWTFNVEVTVRESNKNIIEEIEPNIIKVAQLIDAGVTRIGFKTTRGYGKLKVKKLEKKIFINNTLIDVLDFNYDNMELLSYEPMLMKQKTMECEVELLGGISIRAYVEKPNSHVDYETLTSNNKPIIPATSINGALRYSIHKITKELNCNIKIDDRFTRFYDDDKSASMVRIEDSYIEGGHDVIQTRNAIDRFTGGSMDGSLYSEKTHFNGKTTIKISFDDGCPNYIVGLYYLALLDLINGYQAIGGQTAIGRGVLKGSSIKMDGQEIDNDNNIYLKALIEYINK